MRTLIEFDKISITWVAVNSFVSFLRQWCSEQDLSKEQSSSELEHFERERERERESLNFLE